MSTPNRQQSVILWIVGGAAILIALALVGLLAWALFLRPGPTPVPTPTIIAPATTEAPTSTADRYAASVAYGNVAAPGNGHGYCDADPADAAAGHIYRRSRRGGFAHADVHPIAHRPADRRSADRYPGPAGYYPAPVALRDSQLGSG